MLIFDRNIKFKSWSQIFVGYIFNWTNLSQILQWYEDDKILVCTEERYIEMLVEVKANGIYGFIELMRKYILEDEGIIVSKSEDFKVSSEDYEKLLYSNYHIWMLEDILLFLKQKRNYNTDLDFFHKLKGKYYHREIIPFYFLWERWPENNEDIANLLIDYTTDLTKQLI